MRVSAVRIKAIAQEVVDKLSPPHRVLGAVELSDDPDRPYGHLAVRVTFEDEFEDILVVPEPNYSEETIKAQIEAVIRNRLRTH